MSTVKLAEYSTMSWQVPLTFELAEVPSVRLGLSVNALYFFAGEYPPAAGLAAILEPLQTQNSDVQNY